MDIVGHVREYIRDSSKGTGLRTGDIRRLSAELFRSLEDKSIDHVLDLSEQLLKTGEWAFWIIAYDWAFRVRNQYTPATYYIFERWLMNYVTDWDDCDDFCTHAFGELLSRYNGLFPRILELTEHKRFPVRRGSAVVLIYPIKKGRLGDMNPFYVSDRLMKDEHYLVQKGYGWMLKVLSQYREEEVVEYLRCNYKNMPGLAFRYAMEKLDDVSRKDLNRLKKEERT